MKRIIALVSCVKQKQAHPAPAKDLYTSALFKKMRAYAERHADTWFILSARYGLVHPNAVIEPYEQTLNTATVEERRIWARHVYAHMSDAGILVKETEILWLAGQKYMSDLAVMLSEYGQRNPLRGMPIGVRLSWLNKALREAR